VSELGSERFILTAPPPLRSLAIASLVAVVGAALTVSSRALRLGPAVLVLGIVTLGLAAALVLAAVILVSRLTSTLVLDADGITVRHGRRTERLAWSDIDSVRLTGQRLTFLTKPVSDAEVSVINPRSETDPNFASLVRAIRGRLDANRGYRTG
jgi:PH (Pleckstrin Homology) domain-containing protein